MRIAVASDGLGVSLHGSRCASYTCYTVVLGVITSCQNTPNPCLSAELTADYLKKLGVDVFVTSTIDRDSRRAFERRGIEIYTGATGSTRDAVDAYLTRFFSGELSN